MFARKKSAGLAAPLVAVALFFGATMPAVAQAGTASPTMTFWSRVFPSGAALPAGPSGAVHVVGGTTVTLTAPKYLYAPPVAPATTPSVYEFMFWNANARLIATRKASFTAPTGASTVKVTAWYLPIGGGACTGVCPTSVTTWAFSLTTDTVLTGTPIATVSPSSAWTSPSTSVSTATAATVAASFYFGTHSKLSGTAFKSWFVFGGGVTISGLNLSVAAGASPYAIAFYLRYLGTPPLHCPGPPTTCV